ncbi:MAG TPA: hypothetical protein VFI65_28765 [Streptosporangiaceae bacterium]|nr:hypothetical protein [Streptosporangiaceae bacterium]
MHPGEHILDDVLGRRLIADEQDREPDQLKLVATEQFGQVQPGGLVQSVDGHRRPRR